MSNTVGAASVSNDFYQLQDHVWKQDWSAVFNDLKALAGDISAYVNSPSVAAALKTLGLSASYSLGQKSWSEVLVQFQQGGLGNVKVVDLLNTVSGYSSTLGILSEMAVLPSSELPPLAAGEVLFGVSCNVLSLTTGFTAQQFANNNPNLTLGQIGTAFLKFEGFSAQTEYGNSEYTFLNDGGILIQNSCGTSIFDYKYSLASNDNNYATGLALKASIGTTYPIQPGDTLT